MKLPPRPVKAPPVRKPVASPPPPVRSPLMGIAAALGRPGTPPPSPIGGRPGTPPPPLGSPMMGLGAMGNNQMGNQQLQQMQMAQQGQPLLQQPTPQQMAQMAQMQMAQQGQPMQGLQAQGQGIAQMPMVPGNPGFPDPRGGMMGGIGSLTNASFPSPLQSQLQQLQQMPGSPFQQPQRQDLTSFGILGTPQGFPMQQSPMQLSGFQPGLGAAGGFIQNPSSQSQMPGSPFQQPQRQDLTSFGILGTPQGSPMQQSPMQPSGFQPGLGVAGGFIQNPPSQSQTQQGLGAAGGFLQNPSPPQSPMQQGTGTTSSGLF